MAGPGLTSTVDKYPHSRSGWSPAAFHAISEALMEPDQSPPRDVYYQVYRLRHHRFSCRPASRSLSWQTPISRNVASFRTHHLPRGLVSRSPDMVTTQSAAFGRIRLRKATRRPLDPSTTARAREEPRDPPPNRISRGGLAEMSDFGAHAGREYVNRGWSGCLSEDVSGSVDKRARRLFILCLLL